MNNLSSSEYEGIAVRVSWQTVLINAGLSALKLLAGIFAHSNAMLSDAVNSLTDVVSTFVVMIGVKMAGKKEDAGHPYGHERFESVAVLLLAAMLFVTGATIGWQGIQKVLAMLGQGASRQDILTPGVPALAAAVISIAVKEAMYWYTRAVAKKINSDALMAGAWDHRSDVFSSIGSLIGIAGARMGFPALDPLASIVICAFILRTACGIFLGAIHKMTDTACDPATVGEIARRIQAEDGVLGIDLLQTRKFGNKAYVDVEISVDADATLRQAHDIAERVHGAIEQGVPGVKHCMVHVNPADAHEDSGEPAN